MKRYIFFWILLSMLAASCSTPESKATAPAMRATLTAPIQASKTATSHPTLPPSPTPQTQLTLLPSGPDIENFEAGINPLTGLHLQDPSMLSLPAVLVSISNMPPTARPQAGLSFAPWVYELFIGEGTTRFMSVFYGDLPRRIPNPGGSCPTRTDPFKPNGAWIGRRVWLDENKNGELDAWEAGVAGICISLLQTDTGSLVANTSTDLNGYYAFDASTLQTSARYTLKFEIPDIYQFTLTDIGNDDLDSDPDQTSGKVNLNFNGEINPSWNAGLLLVKPPPAVYALSEIAPERTYVGPIRSGRLTYNDFAKMYPASCLVYASAGDGIRQRLDGCQIIFGERPGVSPNTALLDVSRLKELALASKIANQPVNYSGHLFDPIAPAGGQPANSLWTYFHAFSQSFWQYDPLSNSYLRQTDDGDGLGKFHIDTDRLTGRQLAFENLAIILADYQIFRHGQYDIALCCGIEGYAFLFRDGQMYKIRWSTNNRAWEQKSGLLRPLHFTSTDKQPFPLKPGRTWVSMMTIASVIKDLKDGNWQAYFVMPDDPAPKK